MMSWKCSKSSFVSEGEAAKLWTATEKKQSINKIETYD